MAREKQLPTLGAGTGAGAGVTTGTGLGSGVGIGTGVGGIGQKGGSMKAGGSGQITGGGSTRMGVRPWGSNNMFAQLSRLLYTLTPPASPIGSLLIHRPSRGE